MSGSWSVFAGGSADWDRLVAEASDASLFQSAAWAEYKAGSGWTCERWTAAGSDGSPIAAMQVLLKRLPLGRRLGWAAGGPLTGFPGAKPEDAARLLREWVSGFTARGGVYARFRSHRPVEPEWTAAFSGALSRPVSCLNSGVTLSFDLAKPLLPVKDHRYYIRQAERASLAWEAGHDARLAGEFAALYRGMAEAKGIQGRLFDPASLPRLVELAGSGALVLIGRAGGAPVTGCLTFQTGKNAFYLAAATSAEGRKVGAAYAMLPKLLELLRERGVASFDFGGIAPEDPEAKGVDHFKKGFGGTRVDYLGEWDWAALPGLRRLADAAMKARLR